MKLYFVVDWVSNPHCLKKELEKYKCDSNIAIKVNDSIYEICPLYTDKSNIKKSTTYQITPELETKIKSIETDDQQIIEAVIKREQLDMMIADTFLLFKLFNN